MDSAIAEAVSLHRQGKMADAREAYLSILNNEAGNSDVLNYLSMLEFQTGNSGKGIELAEECLRINADHAPCCNNLANMYLSTYRVDDAERYYLKSIDMDSHAVEPLYNMAIIEKSRKNYSSAEGYFNKVLALSPQHLVCISSLADMYTRLGHLEPALELHKRCLELDLDDQVRKSTLQSVARLCQLLGNQEMAIDIYQKWLEAYPEDSTATHMLAAATGEKVPEKPDRDYVRNMFDKFAGSFDKVLDNLEYKAPQQIQTIIESTYKNAEPSSLNIVDAGCGTGLCGHFLKPLAARLTGVDLSPEMLKRAKQRKQYDVLIEDDLNEYFRTVTEKCNLIVSADTLCYFGKLTDFLQLSYAALTHQGLLVFTVERYDGATASGYHLEAHGRYSHTKSYLQESLQNAGYYVEGIYERDLRLERLDPVKGFLVMGKKPSD